MQIKKVRSMSLPEGVPIPHLDTLKEVLEHFKGDEAKAVEVLNKYGRQKDSLVNARSYLSDAIKAAFPVKTKNEKGKDGKVVTVDDETESEHLDRFADAAAAGKVTIPSIVIKNQDEKEVKVAAGTISGSTPEDKVKSVWQWLQKVVDAHGPFPFDLTAATRVGKPKNPPKYAIDAATSIINNKSEAKWIKKFTDGFAAADGTDVEPISFAPFDQKAASGASAEEVEKVRQSNINNLAWAIDAVETQKRDKKVKKEYA